MATQTLSGQDSTRNGANTMPQPLTRRSFVQGAAALAVAPIVMRVAPKTKPADRMTEITALLLEIEEGDDSSFPAKVMKLRGLFNNLFDVDKHYLRKEYLLFPFLENQGITGPPQGDVGQTR